MVVDGRRSLKFKKGHHNEGGESGTVYTMDDLSIGSSIDGDLNDFLQTQGILSGKTNSYEETKISRDSELRTDRDLGNEAGIEIHEESLFLDNSVSNEEGTSISGIDTADVLLSSCKKSMPC